MKIVFNLFLVSSAVLSAGQLALGQGTFQNLNFESANVPSIPSDHTTQVLTSDALPGWTAYAGTNQLLQIWYNGISAGSASVGLIDRHTYIWGEDVIGGNFTVTISAGINPDRTGDSSAAIAQSSLVPVWANSLWFNASWTAGDLAITFEGVHIGFYPQYVGPNYTTYAGDISAFRGRLGELRFTEEPISSRFSTVLLDDISFSVQSIPEPDMLRLFGLGALLFGWRRLRR